MLLRMASFIVAALVPVCAAAPALAQSDLASVAGLYDGGQAEIAAMLELAADGRYRYQLSYGALDEGSAGTWTRQNEAIVLQSDPFVPPAFTVTAGEGRTGELAVRLDLPDGFDPQYFALTVHRKDGSASFQDVPAGGLVLPMGDNPVVSLRPLLPVMDLLGPEHAVPAGGAALTITFTPNDLGFVGFDREVLPRNGEVYELSRHGRTLRFRKVPDRARSLGPPD
jgi:hypothetical protein